MTKLDSFEPLDQMYGTVDRVAELPNLEDGEESAESDDFVKMSKKNLKIKQKPKLNFALRNDE